MKITLNQDPSFSETEIIINCPRADEELLRLVTMDNGEQIWVSRQYAGELKEKLQQAERSIFQ